MNIEDIFAVICLLSVPSFLAVKYFSEYYEGTVSLGMFGFWPSIALILYLIYLGLYFFLGIDGLYELNDFQRENRKYQTFFLCPTIGFGLAIFPKCATEYIFNYWSFSEFDVYVKYTAFTGWSLILYVASVIFF